MDAGQLFKKIKMKKHKWENNVCVKCGISRERRSIIVYSAIMNHPPWEVNHWETHMKYCLKNGKETFSRPECTTT